MRMSGQLYGWTLFAQSTAISQRDAHCVILGPTPIPSARLVIEDLGHANRGAPFPGSSTWLWGVPPTTESGNAAALTLTAIWPRHIPLMASYRT
ncbi:hypothetical protein BV20DRAFT_378951 [Pilatotrama ljubarskyi]|nr:hypothetical protein BV20DRAFT_378951 [Pilatotrama ljubarskyi]